MKKILIVCALYPPDIIGGAEVACKEYVRLLCRSGFDVCVIACARSADEEYVGRLDSGEMLVRKYVPKVYPTHERGSRNPLLKLFWHLQDNFSSKAIGVFRKHIVEFNPDNIHIHIIQGMGYMMLKCFREFNVPVVFTLHDYGLADYRMTLYRKQSSIAKLSLFNKLLNWHKWRLLSQMKKVSFVSPSQALLDALAKFVPLDKYNSFVLKNPIDFKKGTRAISVDHKPVIGYIGRMHHTKGVDFALKLIEELNVELSSNYIFKFAGGGPLESAVTAVSDRYDNVFNLGFLDQGQVVEFLTEIDLLITPSVWLENSPVVVQQACVYGKPVFVSKRGGLVEFVEDGKNGYLLPPTDFSLWLNRLSDYISEPSLRSSMANYAQNFSSRFHAQALLSKVIPLYD